MEADEWKKWSDDLNKRVTDWLPKQTEKTDDGCKCKKCGQTIMNRNVYCSIHDGYKLFGNHSGFGEVHKFGIPECPNKNCENHKPSFWDKNLHLDENSDTLRGPCYDC